MAILLSGGFVQDADERGTRCLLNCLEAFDPKLVENSADAHVEQLYCGGELKRALLAHPSAQGECVVRYPLELPKLGSEETLVLMFFAGVRDGADWRRCDGVRFRVTVDGDEVYKEDITGPGWKEGRADLSRWAAKKIALELRTHARRGTDFDWACWGAPGVYVVKKGLLPMRPTPRHGKFWGWVWCEWGRLDFDGPRSSVKDPGGATWTVRDYTLSCDRERQLYEWVVRDVVLSGKPGQAIVPGLEYLDPDEPSSNERDARPRLNLRFTPVPEKLTADLVAVEVGEELCIVGWENAGLYFARPDFVHGTKDTWIAVRVPAPKDECYGQPFPITLRPGETLRAGFRMEMRRGGRVLEAFEHTPDPERPPRAWEEELALCREGFLKAVWDEQRKLSKHCCEWPPVSAPQFGTLLWLDYLITGNADAKQRALEIVENADLLSPAGCHIMRYEAAFHFAKDRGPFERLIQIGRDLARSLPATGEWTFQPDKKRESLGKRGDAVLGTSAWNAWTLGYLARITGDEEMRRALEKCLDALKKYRVPRGAQAWECPLYEPDLLAAAYAVGAYVEGYRVTGREDYLQQAKYWASAGLPFLYHRGHRPGMKYASIPVFGTTFFTHSWLGVPVQWNGLVYAFCVQQLAGYEPRWRTVAEGVTVSAMYQQETDGPRKGTYPDGWYGWCTVKGSPFLNPEDIVVNVMKLRWRDPLVCTKRLGDVILNSGAEILEAQIVNRKVTVRTRYRRGETAIVAVYPGPQMFTHRHAADDEVWTFELD